MHEPAQSYDRVPYPTLPRPQTHPDRLAVIGRLAGLETAPVDRCRVLELGAGDGVNTITMAIGLPESEFVALDIALAPVERGRALADELGLTNVRVEVGDISDLPEGLGEFDYVIAHGVYSWVPPAIRDDLLAAARAHLAPCGVALVSYNALPGGHGMQMLREMLMFHIGNTKDPQQRIKEAKSLLELILATPPSVSGRPADARNFLRDCAERALNHNDAHFFHDHIADVNDAIYLRQFVDHAAAHDLRLLGDAEYFSTSDALFPPRIQQILAEIEQHGGHVLKDQYLDFITARQFHLSLLCKREIALDRSQAAAAVKTMHVSGNVEPGPEQEDGTQTFLVAGRPGLATNHEMVKAAYQTLHRAFPRAIPFSALLDESLAESGSSLSRAVAERELALLVERAYAGGQIELHTRPLPVIDAPAERPIASPLARREAASGATELSTLKHDQISLIDDVGRAFIQLLDGTRDREALIDALLPICRPGIPRPELAAEIERKLVEFGKVGLLLA